MCVDYLRKDFEEIVVNVYNKVENKTVSDFDSIQLSNIARDNNEQAISCPDQIVRKIKVKRMDVLKIVK